MINKSFHYIWRRHDTHSVVSVRCISHNSIVCFMKPIKKPFDINLYNQDDSVKGILCDWLRSKGFRAYVNPNKYGIDVLSNWFGDDTGIEVEVKHNWRSADFPYPTVHFASRKYKFLEGNKQVKFVTFNHKRTHILIVDGKEFKKLVTKNTIYTDGEAFFEIPIENCKIVSLEE
jgi:hypothetical protein